MRARLALLGSGLFMRARLALLGQGCLCERVERSWARAGMLRTVESSIVGLLNRLSLSYDVWFFAIDVLRAVKTMF